MVSLSSLLLNGEWRMNWCVAFSRGTIGEWCQNGLGRPAWAHFDPLRGLLRRWCFSCLLERSPFCMWVLGVSFSTVWIVLLIVQASAFSVQVLGVFCLHSLVLELLGVMFTSLLDLSRASWSSHKVLDKRCPEVLHIALKPCINIELQNRHAWANLL
jgi:hypothetical protein